VIALDSDGVPCAFQLKTPSGPRITLREWRDELNKQVYDLVTLKLVHPSLPKHDHHRSFLVTNREIDEEVSRAIDDMNRQWEDRGETYHKLETIVGGQIRRDALDLGTNLWPTELIQMRTLLELLLFDGAEHLPKGKLAGLLESTMRLEEGTARPSRAEAVRSCSSAAVLCAMATKSFSEQQNHFAEIEAWVMYLAHLMAVSERRRIAFRELMGHFEIGVAGIRNALANLIDELRQRSHVVEGDITTDMYVRRVRITVLLGLIGVYVLWGRSEGTIENEVETFAEEFCEKYGPRLFMWGEGAVPHILAFYWYWRTVDATKDIDSLLLNLIGGICHSNAPSADPEKTFPSPYHSASDILSQRFGLAEEKWDEDFRRHSYSLEALIHLYVRQNWKQAFMPLWTDVTRVSFTRFDPESKWRFFLWNTDRGTHWSVCPEYPKRWADLRDEAWENDGSCLPMSIKKYPFLLLLFLCVYPHRMNAETVRWLDSRLREMI
jgi:hypothetical protein